MFILSKHVEPKGKLKPSWKSDHVYLPYPYQAVNFYLPYPWQEDHHSEGYGDGTLAQNMSTVYLPYLYQAVNFYLPYPWQEDHHSEGYGDGTLAQNTSWRKRLIPPTLWPSNTSQLRGLCPRSPAYFQRPVKRRNLVQPELPFLKLQVVDMFFSFTEKHGINISLWVSEWMSDEWLNERMNE